MILDLRRLPGQADRRFHRLLIVASGNRRMRELVQVFDGQLQRTRVATIHLRARPYKNTEKHRSLLAAIRARDVESA